MPHSTHGSSNMNKLIWILFLYCAITAQFADMHTTWNIRYSISTTSMVFIPTSATKFFKFCRFWRSCSVFYKPLSASYSATIAYYYCLISASITLSLVDLVDFKTARFDATVLYLTYLKPALYSAAIDLTKGWTAVIAITVACSI